MSGAQACIAFGKMQAFHRKIKHVCYDNISYVFMFRVAFVQGLWKYRGEF